MNYSSPDYSLKLETNRSEFAKGMRDGIPIGLGYFAVAFSLGITAKAIGLTPITCMITSILCHASAGEYAVYSMIAANATYVEMAIMIFIANARYLLMSTAMSQRMHPSLSLVHRLFMGFGITDELFGIAIARPDNLNPNYMYGGMAVAIPMWALGSGIGCFSGGVLPDNYPARKRKSSDRRTDCGLLHRKLYIFEVICICRYIRRNKNNNTDGCHLGCCRSSVST